MRLSYQNLKLLTFVIIILNLIFFATIIIPWHPKILNIFRNTSKNDDLMNIHIIGKAAIGQYLWLHLISGEIKSINNGFYQIGNKTVKNINFTYLSGPGYIQNSIPADIEYMILILNGRTHEKIRKAQEWLDYIPLMLSLKRVAVILLGDERCDNEWIMNYMRTKGGVIDVLFVVYDTNIVDNKEIFQWPLGVATYRGFSTTNENTFDNIFKKRAFKCNFVGTVYKNSSRESLTTILNSFKDICSIHPREKWVPEEDSASLQNYMNILANSDLTLCPVGVNTECYRIYEALSLGSVPVVEDILTPGNCDSPLKLLKKYNAPLIYLQDWNQLNQILLLDQKVNLSFIIKRRAKLLHWYHNFKRDLVMSFITTLEKKFFGR